MAIKAHYFQAAATILQALLERTDNRSPQDPAHAYQAVEWVQTLAKASGDDPILVMSAARLVAGFMKNPISSHCNKYELLHYAIAGARNLVAAFNHEPGYTGSPQIAPIFSAPNGPAPIATGVPQPQAAPHPMPSNVEQPPPVFMPPPSNFGMTVTNPVPPQPFQPPPAPVADVNVPDFSDLAGMR